MFNKALTSFASLISQRSIIVLVIGLFLLFISTLHISDFKLEASSDSLVLENDEDLKYYREISNSYSTGDFLVVLFTPEKPLFSEESIKNVRKLTNRFEKLHSPHYRKNIAVNERMNTKEEAAEELRK